MKIPISKRLLCCAEMVPRGARVADIGCDHGYLSIYLLEQGIAPSVVAADLRPLPLETARRNAARFAASSRIRFAVGNGLEPVSAGEVDAVVCAGMGGDTIAQILAHCPWVRDARYTLVLQPQSSGNDLRRWLGENGFSLAREEPVLDGGRLYTVMTVYFGGGQPVSPGAEFVSAALLRSENPLVGVYLERIEKALRKTVAGLGGMRTDDRKPKLALYEAALREILEMRDTYDNRSGNS